MRGPSLAGRAGEGLSPHPPQASPLPLASVAVCPPGYTTCYHPQAVSQMLDSVDTNLLFSSKPP